MMRADTPARAWSAGGTGLVTATVVAEWLRPFLTARLPLGKTLVAATIWVAVTALAGTLGMVVAESVGAGRPTLPASRHLVGAAAAWVLIPPALLCWLRGWAWAVVLSSAMGAVLAVCLRGMIPRAGAEEVLDPEVDGPRFADLPAPDSGRPQALMIAVCVELALVLMNRDELFWATMLMAAGAFLLVWKRLTSLNARGGDSLARPAVRAATGGVLAIIILVPMLLARFARMNGGVERTAQAATRSRAEAEKADPNDAYQGIVLFTVQEKKKELPPLPVQRDLLRAGMAKPLVIPFDGAYWYFQTPKRGLGMHPHLAHGDPVALSIYSTGWVPLAMEAHQTLAQPVDLRRCGVMQVTVKNGDNRQGRVDMAVMLTDSTMPGKPSMVLGPQPVVSTEPEHFAFKASPVHEELRYAIPARGGLKKFDEITVMFFPDEQRMTLGARMGIEQFELMPR
ncbi:MAG TPA: hypothetical protein VGF88_01025 [Acidobacteriaceae bacterium]|jgi:hypothetical protein